MSENEPQQFPATALIESWNVAMAEGGKHVSIMVKAIEGAMAQAHAHLTEQARLFADAMTNAAKEKK